MKLTVSEEHLLTAFAWALDQVYGVDSLAAEIDSEDEAIEIESRSDEDHREMLMNPRQDEKHLS